MSSIQSALLSQPLPLSDAFGGGGYAKIKPNLNEEQKAAKDFESVFTTMLLKEMRQTLESDSLFSGDSSDIYGGLFDQFLGQHIADAGGLGLAKVVSEGLDRLKLAERTQPNPPAAKP
jgi:Rod binding domain-containing protein